MYLGGAANPNSLVHAGECFEVFAITQFKVVLSEILREQVSVRFLKPIGGIHVLLETLLLLTTHISRHAPEFDCSDVSICRDGDSR